MLSTNKQNLFPEKKKKKKSKRKKRNTSKTILLAGGKETTTPRRKNMIFSRLQKGRKSEDSGCEKKSSAQVRGTKAKPRETGEQKIERRRGRAFSVQR